MCVCACAVCGMCVHLRSHKGDSAEPVCDLIRHRHFPRRAWGQCLWVSLPVCAVFAPVRASLRAPTCTHTHTHTRSRALLLPLHPPPFTGRPGAPAQLPFFATGALLLGSAIMAWSIPSALWQASPEAKPPAASAPPVTPQAPVVASPSPAPQPTDSDR